MLSNNDWGSIQSKLVAIGKKVSRHGGEVDGPHFHAPREITQITEFESATNLRLPEDFSHFLTELCGGWKFSWNLLSCSNEHQFDGFLGLDGGNDGGDFVGQPQYTLLSLYQSMVEVIHEWVEHGGVDESDFQIVQKCFPLYSCSDGSNFVALCLGRQSFNEIVFLDHDTGFYITDNHVLGRGFVDFIQTYSRTGCQHADVEIDLASPDVQRWESWLES